MKRSQTDAERVDRTVDQGSGARSSLVWPLCGSPITGEGGRAGLRCAVVSESEESKVGVIMSPSLVLFVFLAVVVVVVVR